MGDVSLPNLKPSTATISLRLPASMLDDLKVLANKRDVPYQSLLKVFLAERIRSILIGHGSPPFRMYDTARAALASSASSVSSSR